MSKGQAEAAADESAVGRRAAVLDRIGAAARGQGREPSSVRLMIVTKTYGADAVAPLIGAGHRVFGENRVQEASAKWPALRALAPDIALHLIGPLQSNKAEDAVATFDAIDSVDRPKIARALMRAMERAGRRLPILVQVNTGEEPQKAGVVPSAAPAFIRECREMDHDIRGLMCIPPVDANPGPHFALLAKLAEGEGLEELSMGMSGDFEEAVRQGATGVRVGAGILGPRTG